MLTLNYVRRILIPFDETELDCTNCKHTQEVPILQQNNKMIKCIHIYTQTLSICSLLGVYSIPKKRKLQSDQQAK